MSNKRKILACFFIAISNCLISQQQAKVDSLSAIINSVKIHDTVKVSTYVALSHELRWVNIKEAEATARKGLDLAKKINFYSGQSSLLAELARIYNQIGKTDSSEILFKQAIKLAQNHKLIFDELTAMVGLSELYRVTSRYNEDLVLFDEIETKAKAAKIYSAYASSLNGKGIIYRRKAELSKALQCFQKAISIYDTIKDNKDYTNPLLNMALVYEEMKQQDKAKEIYRKLIFIQKRDHNIKGLCNALINMGSLFLDQENMDSALAYLSEAETLAKKNNMKKTLGSIYLNIGLALFVKNDVVVSEQYMLNSLAIRKEINDKSGEALVLSNLFDMYFKTKKYTQLEKYLKEAIAINSEIGDSLQLKDCYLKFSELYAIQKDYGDAYKYRVLYEDLNNRLHSSETTRIISEMQTKYETEKKEKEIEHLDKENNKKELQLTKKQNQIIIVSGISLCVLVAFIALYFYTNVQKQKQIILKQKELGLLKEQKQKEIIETIITTEEKERKKIASDLHDGLGQILTAAKINLANISEEDNGEKLKNVKELVNAALHESKAMALNLMPLTLKENGLTESIKNICAKYNKPGAQEISFTTYDIPNLLAPIVEVNVYRICQELINNAIKYSQARKIFLQLFCRDTKLIIQIEDNGTGFDKNKISQASLGLNILKERVTLLNGEIEIDSVLEKGTNIFIELSL